MIDRRQIRSMLVDIIDNMKTPEDYYSRRNFRLDWLHAVMDVAEDLARES